MENNQPIIIKRVKRYASGHHGGSWKIAFADFATAMMAFFLVLWLLSTATPEQKLAISGYFKDPVGFTESGTPYIIDLGGTPTLAPENTLNPEDKSQPQPDRVTVDTDQVEGMAEMVERERLELLLQELQNKVDENPQLQKFKDQILFEITPNGLRIQIMDAENRPMFDSGSARLKPYFEDILLAMARHHQGGAKQDQHQWPHRRQAVHRHRRFRQLGALGQPGQRGAACAGGGQLPGIAGGPSGRLCLLGLVRSRASAQPGQPSHRHRRTDQKSPADHRGCTRRGPCPRCPAKLGYSGRGTGHANRTSQAG